MKTVKTIFLNGYIIGILSIIISSILFYTHIVKINIIPDVIYISLFVIDIIFLILYYLAIRANHLFPQKALLVFQYIKIIVSILLLVFLCWMNKQIESVVANATDTSKIYLVASKQSHINEVEDIENETIFYSQTTTQYSVDKINERMKKDGLNNEFKSLASYNTLSIKVQNDNNNLFLIEGAAIPMIEQNNQEFGQQIKIITSFKKEKNVKTKAKVIKNGDTSQLLGKNNKPFTIFISGIDVPGEPSQDALSDVDIILFLYPDVKTVKMTSIPRDTYIANPALNYDMDKFTHTGVYGIENTVKAAEEFFNIDINYYTKVSFSSLEDIVEIIDGIEVDVEIQFCEQDKNRSFKEQDLICLNPGVQKLNGEQALAYARHRKTEGYNDQGRNRAQQKIISAIMNKLLSTTSVQKIPEVINNLTTSIDTDMPKKDILSFAKSQLENPRPWTFETLVTLDGYGDMQPTASMGWDLPLYVWQADSNSIDKVTEEFLLNCKKYELTLPKCKNSLTY